MSLLILVVDDEPDVEALFRQQFRRDIRDGRFTMDFAQSADSALKLISNAAGASLILILSDVNMPGMTGLELLPKAKALRPDVPVIMITAYGDNQTKRKALEGGAEALYFGVLQAAGLHASECLTLHQLSEEVDDGQHEAGETALDVLRVGVYAEGGAIH